MRGQGQRHDGFEPGRGSQSKHGQHHPGNPASADQRNGDHQHRQHAQVHQQNRQPTGKPGQDSQTPLCVTVDSALLQQALCIIGRASKGQQIGQTLDAFDETRLRAVRRPAHPCCG